MNDSLFAAALPLIEERGNLVVFGIGDDEGLRWGEPDNRAIEGCAFSIDKRYWEMLGKPDPLIVGFANEAGWEKWVHTSSPDKPTVLQAFEGGEI